VVLALPLPLLPLPSTTPLMVAPAMLTAQFYSQTHTLHLATRSTTNSGAAGA
jgi:hypothetical protein